VPNEFRNRSGQILGTTDTGETRKIKVDDNGNVKTTVTESLANLPIGSKKWEYAETNLLVQTEIRNTNEFNTIADDVSNYGMLAIRVNCTLNQQVKILLYCGTSPLSTTWTTNGLGNMNEIILPANLGMTAYITEEDWPALRYQQWLRVKVQAVVAPTAGFIKIDCVKKR